MGRCQAMLWGRPPKRSLRDGARRSGKTQNRRTRTRRIALLQCRDVPARNQQMPLNLVHPPIVEAVLDIDCDLPPGFRLAEEGAYRDAFADQYPKSRPKFVQQHVFEPIEAGLPKVT